MHHFCFVHLKPESKRTPAELVRAIDWFVNYKLIFVPEQAHLLTSGPNLLVGFSCNHHLYGVDSYVHTGRSLCAVGGLPTFESVQHPSRIEPPIAPARILDDLLDQRPIGDVYESVGGCYSVARADEAGIIAFGSFSGYDSLFYLETPDLVALGNKPSLVAAFQPEGPCSSKHLVALSMVPAATMILGRSTPWSGVYRVPTGWFARVDSEGRLDLARISSLTELPAGAESSAWLDQSIDRLVDRYRWYLSLGLPLETHLTGGKDSRANLALLAASDTLDRVNAVVTFGSDESGDVQIARKIAERVGLANHEVRIGPKRSASGIDLDAFLDRVRFNSWRYDLYLTAYDGASGAGNKPPGFTTFMGGGGEVYRQKGIDIGFATHSLSTVYDRFLNWYYRFDSLSLLAAEWRDVLSEIVRELVSEHLDDGTINLQQQLYIEHRMANWGNGHFRSNASPSIAGLLDLNLARYCQQFSDVGDIVHYRVIQRCAPELASVPFANDEWSGPTKPLAQEEGAWCEPLVTEVKASFPWQFEVFTMHRREIAQGILDRLPLWKGVVSEEGVRRLLNAPPAQVRSEHIKMLFGLLGASFFLADEQSASRDFEPWTRKCRLQENLSSDGVQLAPIRDSLHRIAGLVEDVSVGGSISDRPR